MKKRFLATAIAVLLAFAVLPPVTTRADEVTVTIHYHRDDGDYDKWNIWSWAGADGTAYPFTETDAFGVIAEITLDARPGVDIGFIVRTDAWEKDVTDDRFINLDEGSEIWVFTEKAEFYYDPPEGYTSAAREFSDMTIEFNYFRYDGDYSDLTLSVTGGDYAWDIPISAKTAFGALAKKDVGAVSGVSTAKFCVKRGDEIIDYADGAFKLSKADEAGVLAVWARQGVSSVSYKQLFSAPAVEKATIESVHRIRIELNAPHEAEKLSFAIPGVSGEITPIELIKDDATFGALPEGYARVFALTTEETLDFSKEYVLRVSGFPECAITLGAVFDSVEFADMFTYNDENGELGAVYSKDGTSFTLWAPTVSRAEVRLYEKGRVVPNMEEAYEVYPMEKGTNGSWTAHIEGDLNGKFYMYAVTSGDETREAVDPYARAVGVNGMRGEIIDLAATNPAGWASDKRPETKNPTDAIIYELHVRDLSTQAESGITNKGRFLGIAEKGTTSPAGEKTGLDHIIDLGVTHVHLLPSYDYKTINELFPGDNAFNWGYDPQNYNTPEGSYSTDPGDGAVRVSEFKQMVKTLHDNDIALVMDVVYNHMYSGDDSNFQKLVPGYYFRFKPDGSYSNGSGCGNETASERAMMRKFMIDSVTYWATEYHVDGFRFDLMALHDIETMNLIREALDKIDPEILIYGEGWTGGGTTLPIDQQSLKASASKLNSRIAVFSDDMRDGIKGSVFDGLDPGYINGRTSTVMDIKYGIVASTQHPQVDLNRVSRSDTFWANDPTQTITYASAHDNLTLWDKLIATGAGLDDAALEKQNRLSAAIVLTSQGIPFFQAGEEMARTKNGDENSYMSPDRINQLNWARKSDFKGLFEYYKGLIALRKATPAFRLATGDAVRENLAFFDTGEETVIGYTLAAGAGGGDTPVIAVIINGNDNAYDVPLPSNGWDIMVNGDSAGLTSLGEAGATLSVAPKAAYVLFQNPAAAKTETVAANDTPAEQNDTEAQPQSDSTSETQSGVSPFVIIPIVAGVVVVIGLLIIVGLRRRKR